jgi:hypothetical protein
MIVDNITRMVIKDSFYNPRIDLDFETSKAGRFLGAFEAAQSGSELASCIISLTNDPLIRMDLTRYATNICEKQYGVEFDPADFKVPGKKASMTGLESSFLKSLSEPPRGSDLSTAQSVAQIPLDKFLEKVAAMPAPSPQASDPNGLAKSQATPPSALQSLIVER